MSLNRSLSYLANSFLKLSLGGRVSNVRNYGGKPPRPKYRPPPWHVQKDIKPRDELITQDNKEFIREMVGELLARPAAATSSLPSATPLNEESCGAAPVQWAPGKRRVGLIGKKIGDYPLWDKKGNRIYTSLIQIVENQVVNFTPPEKSVVVRERPVRIKKKKAVMLVGAETVDPTRITKEYYGLFAKTGVPPKKLLARFMVSPDAELPPGTPLLASHFRVGDRVDVRGLTIDRGFQGVMKRWGFKGMPKTHGVTKTHRRPGNIGGGGEKGRVWPGQKMPGHMGNRWRILRGVRILRINTKYNVIWCEGVGIPGGTGSMVYMYDTFLPNHRPTTPPPYPTYFETGNEEEDIIHEDIHPFDAPTIEFQPE